ncbi:hypothetical protein [Corallococcus llansteffanensis]|uniref:hypothetical protein n=1 Tax=Corallococcus llansteffanensis TaxID=2316731 RepID=UPI00131554CC|nr:hypothetical protein [Corallococcus llansteffanensis]
MPTFDEKTNNILNGRDLARLGLFEGGPSGIISISQLDADRHPLVIYVRTQAVSRPRLP